MSSPVASVYLVLSGRLTPGEVAGAYSAVRCRWRSARVVTSKETGGRHDTARILAERVALALPESGVMSPAEVTVSQGAVVVWFRGTFLRSGSWRVEPVDDVEIAGVLKY